MMNFLKQTVLRHAFSLVSLTIILILFICSLPHFLDSNVVRISDIELNTSATADTPLQELIHSDQFQHVQKDTTTLPSSKFWIRMKLTPFVTAHREPVTIFSLTNTNLTEMMAYSVVDDQAQIIAHCSDTNAIAPCLSRSFKHFIQILPKDSDQQWVYIYLNKKNKVLHNQFYVHHEDPDGLFAERLLSIFALLQGTYFLYFLIGIIFFIALKDQSLLYFGLFYICLFLSTQLNRSMPLSELINVQWRNFLGTLMMCCMLSLKIALIITVSDLRRVSPRMFYLYVSLAICSIGVAVIYGFTPKWFSAPQFSIAFLSIGLMLICALIGYLMLLRTPMSMNVSMSILIGVFSALLWSLNRSGVLHLNWITEMYPGIGDTISGWLILSLIFLKVNQIISDRNLVQFRMQESRMAKSLLRALSHDLSNTTQVIISNSHLIEMNVPTGKPIDKYLERIVSSATIQSHLINHFKNNYMIRGINQVQLSSVPLITSIKQSIALLNEGILKKNLDMQVISHDAELNVIAEASSLTHQVFSNLLSNAIKYSPPKGIIRFTVKSTGTHAEIHLVDQGPGIKPEVLAKIFDDQIQLYKFERTEEGTGFGLLIVQDFIKAFGGEIHFKNYPNNAAPEGLSITLRLKLT